MFYMLNNLSKMNFKLFRSIIKILKNVHTSLSMIVIFVLTPWRTNRTISHPILVSSFKSFLFLSFHRCYNSDIDYLLTTVCFFIRNPQTELRRFILYILVTDSIIREYLLFRGPWVQFGLPVLDTGISFS